MAVDSLSWQQSSCLLSYLYHHHQHHIVRSWCHHINSEPKRDVALSVKESICEEHLQAKILSSKWYNCHQFDHAGNPFKDTFDKKNPPLHSIMMVVSICIDITIDRWCHQYYGIGTIAVAPVSSCCLASSMSTINIIIMLNIITYDQYQDYHRYHQRQQYHNWQICSAVPSIPWWSYLLLVLIQCWRIHFHNNFPSFIFP